MASQWFVRGGGKVYGPLDDARLRSLVSEAKINESTEVATDPKGPWHPASRVRGLFARPNSPVPNIAPQDSANAASMPNSASAYKPSSDYSLGPQVGAAEDGFTPEVAPSPPAISCDKTLHPNFTKRPAATIALPAKGLLFGAAVVAALFGVGVALLARREVNLAGSVFIVKADGESVRLGLTDIYVVPASDITEEIVSDVKKTLESLRSAESSLDYYSRPSQIDRAFSSPAVAQRHKMDKTLDASRDRGKALGRLHDLRAALVQNALSQTKTDADGDFEIQLPNAPVTSIVAYASRKIDAHSEHYFWIISSEDAKKQKPRLFISNDNKLR